MAQRRRARPHRGRPQPRGGRGGRESPTQARLLALRVLERVERTGAYADLALRPALARSPLSSADRALATELVFGTLRWRGRLDHLLAHVLDRELAKLEPGVSAALRLGAYQIIFTDRIPDHAAVDETVRCLRAAGRVRATGLANAVLRRLAAQGREIPLPRLDDDPVGHLSHALSLPAWLALRWLERFGAAEAAALAAALNRVPPLTVRANPLRVRREALLAELRDRHPAARPCALAAEGIRLEDRGDPGREPAFVEGRFTVQDEASQLVVDLLDPRPGERVLDTCAAPGTKATALAERVGPTGAVRALDRHARRLDLVARDARRLGLPWLRTEPRDATRPLDDLADVPFDRVLVDAPCTGLGALRRSPDLRWRVGPEDPARLAETQAALLAAAALVLRPGGALVYSTCSFEPEETDAVIEDFLARTPGFRRVAPGTLPARLAPVLDAAGTLRTWPHHHDADGFFAVRLERVQ